MFSRKSGYLIACLLLLILILLPSASQAQTPTGSDEWQVWLYDSQSDQLYAVSPNGITDSIDLAEYSGFAADQIQRPIVSPDSHTLAFEIPLNVDTYGTGVAGIYLADIETQDCCRQLSDPNNPEFIGYYRGPFSPDGTQLVASMWTDSGQLTPEVAVFEVASGNIIHRLPITELSFQTIFEDDSFVEAAVFNEWSTDGIRIGGTCRSCPASLIFFDHTQIWNPETNELSDPVTVITDPLSVLATGELIDSTFDESFPGGDQPPIGIGEGVGTIYPANIVRYYPDHTQTPSEVIFNRPEPPMIESVHWVANGRSMLVFLNPDLSSEIRRAVLVDRNGGQQTTEFFFDDTFIAPTPDGWLMCHFDGEQIYILHHQQTDNGFAPTEIATLEAGSTCYFSRFEVVGQNFVLGDGLDAPPFAP